MASIVISTAGTWGDLLPLLALGKELLARGHSVKVAANEALHPLIRGAGFEPRACGPAFGPDDARRPPIPREGWEPIIPEVKKAEAHLKDTPQQFRDLLNACEGADLLVSNSFQYAAMLVHNKNRIPWTCVSTTPGQFEHYDCAACTQPAPRATLNLLASSPLFSAVDLELTDYLRMTGFLYFDGTALPDWKPSRELKAFVEDGERVLVYTPGCIPGPCAQGVALTAARAAVQLKRKLVIQSGWADLNTQELQSTLDSGYVRLAGPLPHDWLFARADAVFHHGGAGLCARTLRSEAPSLVLPQRADQFFNARGLLALGTAAAMAPAQLTVEGVKRILEEKVLSAAFRDSANAISSELRKEDGAQAACRLIEELL